MASHLSWMERGDPELSSYSAWYMWEINLRPSAKPNNATRLLELMGVYGKVGRRTLGHLLHSSQFTLEEGQRSLIRFELTLQCSAAAMDPQIPCDRATNTFDWLAHLETSSTGSSFSFLLLWACLLSLHTSAAQVELFLF
ncbi:hypothetical protein NDU88_002482 [Pleurodeles waltl]|uniref:Uncharacterized protein n=1 Tax=Pleurodeles waltl TaxID=8319 RepID=A0AAV7U9F0_PLEWA|nr:hypothetical protein NDU88_002482 [Pleurodeles waltl]